ncbi:polymorphic toxin-type HINT domain-containing protein [Streptomyces vinaceus]|uniref:polymorphic toxin-type HINT domain-containing protein n=1 Tax=Streptomyces vinaceus TaxID=1960 RepID=UPI0037F2D0DC
MGQRPRPNRPRATASRPAYASSWPTARRSPSTRSRTATWSWPPTRRPVRPPRPSPPPSRPRTTGLHQPHPHQRGKPPRSADRNHLHPYWSETRHQWVDAGELTPNEHLRQPDGTTVTVQANHNYPYAVTTHNLTVNDFHTSTVTCTQIRIWRMDVAKNPDATYTPTGHVIHGSKPNWKPQFILSTRSRTITMGSQRSGPRVVAIDLSKLDPSQVLDLPDDVGRAAHNIRGFTAINRTKSSQEALIAGRIPPEAMTWVRGGP